MAEFISPMPEVKAIDTDSGSTTVSLTQTTGKRVYIFNKGTSGNVVQVNYGVDSYDVDDSELTLFLYDGEDWVVSASADTASLLSRIGALEDSKVTLYSVDASSSAQSVTLPDATATELLRMYIISGTNGVTFDTTSAQTIDGASSITYSEEITVLMMPTGGNWRTHLTARSDSYIDGRAITQALVFS
jgi:hypothetical protein